VLTGRTSPSGKLADTFPLTGRTSLVRQLPRQGTTGTDPNARGPLAGDRAAEIVYQDDIWVGYRHFASKA